MSPARPRSFHLVLSAWFQAVRGPIFGVLCAGVRDESWGLVTGWV